MVVVTPLTQLVKGLGLQNEQNFITTSIHTLPHETLVWLPDAYSDLACNTFNKTIVAFVNQLTIMG